MFLCVWNFIQAINVATSCSQDRIKAAGQ